MNFVRRFRVAARKFLYFQKRLAKLGPSYYGCNERQTSCTRKAAQPRKGCPNCEYTIQYKLFLKELDKELRELKKGTRKGARRWPMKDLLRMVVEIGSMANRYSKLPDPNWPVLTDTLVSVYRDESAKMQAIDNFNLSATSAPVTPSQQDDGDFD